MLCAKCHRNEATIHFTTVGSGTEEETVHLCIDCAPPTGIETLEPEQLEALSVIGKTCEFCGKEAFSGLMLGPGGAIYWCFDCGVEFGRIVMELLTSERPELLQRSKEAASFLSICGDSDFQAWSEAANQKALQILRERRRQDSGERGG